MAPYPDDPLTRAMEAIAAIESGGRYDRLGPVTRRGDRAYGRYQVMGSNVGPWTERYAGRRMTPQEFLADQRAQDAVFRGQFGEYARRYGPERAAGAWFAGPGGMDAMGRRDQLGTSVGRYRQRFMSAFGAPAPQVAGWRAQQPAEPVAAPAAPATPPGDLRSLDALVPPLRPSPPSAPVSDLDALVPPLPPLPPSPLPTNPLPVPTLGLEAGVPAPRPNVLPNPLPGTTPGGDWDYVMQPSPEVPPFETTTERAPDADSIVRQATRAHELANPPAPPTPAGPGFFDRLMADPMFLAGLTILGTPPGGAWGPNAAQALAQAQRSRREQTEFERQQGQRSTMDRVWREAFPNGQPNMQHPLLAGQSPQVAALLHSMGPETALPLLGRSAMSSRQLELKDIGGQGVIFDPRTGQVVTVPGTGPRPPEAIRTNALRADAAYRSLSTALDDYQRLVEREGITAMPGAARDAVTQARTNIQLQLKELYNLGVLNGPDLELMEKMLVDTSLSASNVFANPAGRVASSVQRLKAMLKAVRDSAAAAAGRQPQDQQQPQQRRRYDPATGDLVNAN